MTITTLNLIHDLLKKHAQKLDEKSRDATQALTQAYRDLQIAEECPDGGRAEADIANAVVEVCKDKKKRACERLSAAQVALDDFETHDWH